MSKQIKAVPKFANEAEERAFWESHDSTEFVELEEGPARRVAEP